MNGRVHGAARSQNQTTRPLALLLVVVEVVVKRDRFLVVESVAMFFVRSFREITIVQNR